MAAACLVVVALAAAPAGPAGAANWTGKFSVWRNGAFATQYLDYSCVGATVQMTLNLVKGAHNHSKSHQLSYLAYAAANSKYPVTDGGADPQGWAVALNHFGAGNDWGWTTSSTRQAALNEAAKQIRETGKPVGLLVYYGRHAWLMTGFEATADPATTNDYNVTAAEVVGPLWPDGTLNGKPFDPGPGTWLSTPDLVRKFNAYTQPDQPIWYGKYVTVVPRVSEVGQGGSPGDQAPDLKSAPGWIYVFDRLALSVPVRDYLWLP